jgi:hypothetical protein
LFSDVRTYVTARLADGACVCNSAYCYDVVSFFFQASQK